MFMTRGLKLLSEFYCQNSNVFSVVTSNVLRISETSR